MVKQEFIPGTDWYRTWSDIGRNLLQVETNDIYGDEVIDHVSNTFTYQETDIGLDEELSNEDAVYLITEQLTYSPLDGESPNEEEAGIILDILLGNIEEEEE